MSENSSESGKNDTKPIENGQNELISVSYPDFEGMTHNLDCAIGSVFLPGLTLSDLKVKLTAGDKGTFLKQCNGTTMDGAFSMTGELLPEWKGIKFSARGQAKKLKLTGILSEKLGLTNVHILAPKTNTLLKLVVFCPVAHAENVQQAMFDAGAGNIGNYDSCSFNSTGYGTFKASDKANPYVGEAGSLHKEEEVRIETVAPEYLLNKIISSMLAVHPYEEVAYDIFPLANEQQNVGAGIIGELQHESDGTKFLKFVKQQLNAAYIRHTEIIDKPVKKVAVCGGSCSFLIHQAYRAGADIFITADVKYHEFFDYKGKMTIVDAGHYETEQFAKELLYAKLKGKFPNFALQISNTITNPINFL